MPATAGERSHRLTPSRPYAADTARAPALTTPSDNWPHTRRPLPWLLAGFLAMLFLLPFDSIILKVHMPANATLDRVLLMSMLAVFLASRRPTAIADLPDAG